MNKRACLLLIALFFVAALALGNTVQPLIQLWYQSDSDTISTVGNRNVSMGKPAHSHTTDATLTEAQCRGAINDNQGASGEVDLTMYASDKGNMVMFRQEEPQVIEVGPETDGYIILDGTALDQGDCVDSDGATIGSWMMCQRGQNASGTAVWICDSDGNWTDTGASD
jgi:hypothetical protein